LAILLLVPALALAGASSLPSAAWSGDAQACLVSAADTTATASCCKICRKGKACGNTCIARDKDCHQPPGCACDG
jgi:hypothetical protein